MGVAQLQPHPSMFIPYVMKMSVFQSGRLHKSCWDQFKKTGRHSHCACCIFKKTWAGAKSFRIFIKQWHVVDHRIPNLFAPNFLGNTAYFAAIARWGHTAHVSTVGGTFSTSGSSHSPCFFWIPFMYSTWGSRKKLNPTRCMRVCLESLNAQELDTAVVPMIFLIWIENGDFF